jgi:phospholipid/cholesterol/gamma-HCH transport system ATP-binding protein
MGFGLRPPRRLLSAPCLLASLLLKHLIGLLKPDAGQVLIEGRDIVPLGERELLAVRRKFGMLFQEAVLFDSMTVAEIRQQVAAALEVVDLAGIENTNPAKLSGGMKKRVGLARAIVYRPETVLYGEPTTGLDPVVADGIDRLILRVRDRFEVTTVVVTHDMRSARRVGQRILMLHEKTIYAAGTPDEIFASRDPVVRRFIEGVSDPREHPF